MYGFLSRGLRAQPAIDGAVREAALRAIAALGLLSGLGVALMLWIPVLAFATIIGFGAGTPSGNFSAVLGSTWPLALVLSLAGGIAGISRRYVQRLHPGWDRIGAGIAVYAVFLILALTWAFRQRLIQGDALTRQAVYEVPGSLYRATESDGLLILWFGFAALAGAILFTVAAGGLLDFFVVRRLPVAEAELDQPTPAASDFQRDQTGLSRLKLEIVELRDRARQPGPTDRIISATDVIDREAGRAVPRWMEPLADLNFKLGKGMLIVFIISALAWFTAVSLKAPEEWFVWRNSIFVTPTTRSFLVPIELVPNISAIRLHAAYGEGDVIGGLARRGAPRAIPDRVVRLRGYPERFQAGAPPNIISFDGLEPGDYVLYLDSFSGSLLVGMAAERTSAVSTHVLAVVLGVAAAGLLAGGAGLTLIAATNFRAYFDL